MTVSLHPPYRVSCNHCGATGPASDISPGLARAEAARLGWGIEPGDRFPVDTCPGCTPKEN